MERTKYADSFMEVQGNVRERGGGEGGMVNGDTPLYIEVPLLTCPL